MSLDQYLVTVNSRTNICFDCENYARCSWGRIDEKTKKPMFQPVPGWTAEPVRIYGGIPGRYIDTYHITNCHEFLRDEPKRAAVTGVGG